MPVDISGLKQRVIDAIDQRRSDIIAIGDSIYSQPELGYKEFLTAGKVKKVFDELGISYRNEVGITGVVGSLKGKESKVKVAVTGELDAVLVSAHPDADPVTGAVHACGHNCMIAALCGVAYALKDTGIMDQLSGDVVFMAVPAEECVEIEYRNELKKQDKITFIGGKQEFIKLGEYDDIDIIIMEHNVESSKNILAYAGNKYNGFTGKLVRYTGRAAHAGGAPHRGVNALNAATLGLEAIAMQRETFKDEDNVRIHSIITKGGELINIVPDDVRLEVMVRGANMEAIVDASAKVNRSLEAGAYAIGAKVEIEEIPGYFPVVLNNDLMDIMFENQKLLLGEDRVIYEAEKSSVSTDAGDISALIPTLHAIFTGCSGDLHSVDFRICDKEIAYIATAKALPMTVIDLLADGAVNAFKVKENFVPTMTKEQYLKDWGMIE